MLPILPALLLLILQGPSSIEKMALDGRLPAALEAVSRQMESHDHKSGSIERADAAVLASLWALSSDPDLSHALIQLLALDTVADSSCELKSFEPGEWVDKDCFTFENLTALPEPFFASQRSRDGPF